MISVGTRDARKELGLGFGGRREMEDTELEEGEACSSHINEYDPNIDPDVALSYIDDRIQDVLGQFQKDFEGGVSAENLGAKFGGYGSFLPSYQRSPVWSHSRTPPKVHNYSLPKSPYNVKLEGGQRNNVVCYTTPQSVGLGPASTGSTSLVAPKAPSANDPVKQEGSMSLDQADQYASRYESANKKAISLSDQKTLKVRIKVGSDNLSTRKNAIYSGLGLDGTPSSSLDDSPSDSEGISHEPQDVPFESPTSILQIMTSFPVDDGMMSPLPDDLIYLTEKEKLLKEGRSVTLPRDGWETSGSLANGTHTMEGGGKLSARRKTKSVERNDFSAESKNGNNKDGIGLLSKKEHDVDSFACEELVSKTLQLPLLSNSFSAVNDVIKSKELDKKYLLKDGQVEDEPVDPMSNQEDAWVEKRKSGLAGKVQEDRKVSSSDDVLVHPKKEGPCRREKTYESVKGDLNVSKGRKALNTEVMDHSKQKVNQRAMSHEVDDTRLLSGKEYPLPAEKKKSKESHRTLVAELPKESLMVGSSSGPKMKSTHVNNSNTDPENFKLCKDLDKIRDTDRGLFGDNDDRNQMELFEFPSEDKLKDSDAVARSTSAVNSGSRERPSGKKIDKPLTSASFPTTASNIAPRFGNGPIFAAAPALIEDNWVCCDKCQKWRLLPHVTNPDNLPEKWLCSMLNWLPGMNRCSVSEEETTEKTKALIAQCQVPAPESQNNVPRNPGGFMEGEALPKSRNPDQNLESFGLHAMPSGGKKKNEPKELSNASNRDGSVQLPNSMKKNIQASVKSRSLNDVNQSPLLSEPDLQQLSKSSDMAVEKRKHKYKEKRKVLEPSTNGETGDIMDLKIKSRRDSDPDSSRASKKIKTEVKRITEEEWASDYSVAVGEVGPSSSSGFRTAAAGKDQIKNRPQAITKAKDEILDNRSLDTGNCDSKGRSKKRKVKEFPDTQIHMGSIPATGSYVQDRSVVAKEEFSENDYRKEKKARASRSDGKESSASKGSGRTDKKNSHTKNQQLRKDVSSGLTHRSRNGTDSLKKDLGSVQVPMAATSSSSKVSGSQKTKSSFQEVKGSPVESVSSSPMRILNPDKLTSVHRDLMGKDEAQDAGHFAIGSPRRCSDGEDDGGSDRSGTARRDKFSTVANHGSLDSSVLDFQDRDSNHISGGKARGLVVPSPDITNGLSVNGALGNSGQDTRFPSKPLASNQFGGEDRDNGNHYHGNGSRPRKSGKDFSSSWSKDKNGGSFESDLDMGDGKNSNVVNELQDHSLSHEIKPRDGKNKLQEKFGLKSGETENKNVGKKDFTGKPSNESSKRESQSNLGGNVGPDAICKKDAISTLKQHSLQDCDSERPSRRIPSEKPDRVDKGTIRGKSLPLPPSGGAQNEMTTRCPRPASGSHKSNGADSIQVDASEGNNAVKVQIQTRKADNQNGTQHISSRHLTQNGHRARDLDAPSPVRRDSSSQAVKEAKDLKHLADRLKNSGSSESTGLYFQAAVKFLHAASQLELTNSEGAKHNESIQMYSSTAKLWEFCAHEYEKAKDMAAAALAYKCMEVAYMKVIYSSHASASRDRLELQTALQMVPPGESPSSSASDVDNLNNPSTVDKVALPKGVSSPQVAGNHVIAARNRPNFLRMLNFAQDVNFAMEASRKSRIAFAAANTNVGDAKRSEGISSIKRALDFNFHDVEGLLRLVRLAMDAISR